MIRGVLPTRNQWAFRKQHNERTADPRRNPQQPHFPHPRRICLTDSLIPADTSDRERRKARGLGYPTATRLAPADLLGRRGNGATLLMLPPRGPREVARGGKPRGECLLQTSGRAERHTILAILGQSRAQTDLIRTRRERSIARSKAIGKLRAGGYRPPTSSLRSHPEKSRWPPDARLVHNARGLLLPAREAGLPTNGTSKPHGMSACAGLR